MKLLSGHEVVPLDEEEMKRQRRDWAGYTDGLVRLKPGNWVFPKNYRNFADKYYNFQFKKNDVIVMTYPKCGTTWTQEVVWTMRNNPNLDNPEARSPVMARSPFFEMDMLFPEPKPGVPKEESFMADIFKKRYPDRNPDDGVNLQMSELTKEPRTIKIHLSLSHLPPDFIDNQKVVYVARNPKDLIVSYHHHSRLLNVHGYRGTFAEFVQYFVDDDCCYGPYWLHVKEAWEKRDHPNMYFTTFESMKADPVAEITKLDKFLNTNLTETQIKNIAQYTSFSEMKKRDEELSKHMPKEATSKHRNEEVLKKDGGFYRKGEAGDWKGKYTPELEAKVDEWVKKKMNFGIDFKYGV